MLDLASNTAGTFIANTAATTFTSIATDSVYFYGWIQQAGDNSVLVRYDSLNDFATNTNPVQVGFTGSGDFVAIAAAPAVPEPGSFTLVAMGMAALGAGWRLRRKRSR